MSSSDTADLEFSTDDDQNDLDNHNLSTGLIKESNNSDSWDEERIPIISSNNSNTVSEGTNQINAYNSESDEYEKEENQFLEKRKKYLEEIRDLEKKMNFFEKIGKSIVKSVSKKEFISAFFLKIF